MPTRIYSQHLLNIHRQVLHRNNRNRRASAVNQLTKRSAADIASPRAESMFGAPNVRVVQDHCLRPVTCGARYGRRRKSRYIPRTTIFSPALARS